MVVVAFLNNLYRLFILNRISLVIHGADDLLILTSFHGAWSSQMLVKSFCQAQRMSSLSSKTDATWNGADSISPLNFSGSSFL